MSRLRSSSILLTLWLLIFVLSIHTTSASETEIKKCAAAKCLFRQYSQTRDNREDCCVRKYQNEDLSCDYCTGKDLCERVRRVVEVSEQEMRYEIQDLDGIIRYCCEKYGVCLLHKYSYNILACLGVQKCGGNTNYRTRKACCKSEIGCDIPLYEPDPNSRLDYPCVSFKQGSCMPYWDLELCCGEYGIGCDADVCPVEETEEIFPGSTATNLPKCCFDKSDCLHPYQWGECCEVYNKCNKRICDPMYDNVTTTVSVFDEVNQQQPKKIQYRVPEVRGYGIVRDG